MQEIAEKDRAAFGTKAAQGGDGLGLAGKVSADGGGDANAAHCEAREAHKDQEGAKALHKAGDAWRTVAAVPPAQPGALKGGSCVCFKRGKIGLRRQIEAIVRGEERAGGQKAAFRQITCAHKGARGEGETIACVRFAQQAGHVDEAL